MKRRRLVTAVRDRMKPAEMELWQGWRMPPPGDPPREPLLDPYRDRGGRVRADDGRIGTVYVAGDVWRVTPGSFWRRRWVDEAECPAVWIDLGDGWHNDYVLPNEDIPTLAEDWARGTLGTFNGLVLSVEWLDEEQSRAVRRQMGIGDR
jgi:hypothetical protein